MELVIAAVAIGSLLLAAQSFFSLFLMLYSWENPERLEASRGPDTYLPPRLSFSVLLPARHEEAVIYETIRKVATAHYPPHLMETVVICSDDDIGTIAEADRAIRDFGMANTRVETFDGEVKCKPRGLNVGLRSTTANVVAVFDAEDDIHPDIFNIVNTVMLQEEVGIVQAGVQLMNLFDHWFAIHNVLEYFFWFKSRLHFHAQTGMVPLGGNTVFFKRHLLERIGGWDEQCLTEDADIGLRLSLLGEPIRIVYDPERVTREETPDTVGALVRQRTRWHQGFLQVLRKGTWLSLPEPKQRLLAAYTFSFPIWHAILTLIWPLALASMFWLKLPDAVSLLTFLPLYGLGFHFLVTAVGAYLFTREYSLRAPFWMPLAMAITFLPYQFLLGFSSLRAAWRELRRKNDWEKTAHIGAHRQAQPAQFGPGLAPARGPALTRRTAGAGARRVSLARSEPR